MNKDMFEDGYSTEINDENVTMLMAVYSHAYMDMVSTTTPIEDMSRIVNRELDANRCPVLNQVSVKFTHAHLHWGKSATLDENPYKVSIVVVYRFRSGIANWPESENQAQYMAVVLNLDSSIDMYQHIGETFTMDPSKVLRVNRYYVWLEDKISSMDGHMLWTKFRYVSVFKHEFETLALDQERDWYLVGHSLRNSATIIYQSRHNVPHMDWSLTEFNSAILHESTSFVMGRYWHVPEVENMCVSMYENRFKNYVATAVKLVLMTMHQHPDTNKELFENWIKNVSPFEFERMNLSVNELLYASQDRLTNMILYKYAIVALDSDMDVVAVVVLDKALDAYLPESGDTFKNMFRFKYMYKFSDEHLTTVKVMSTGKYRSIIKIMYEKMTPTVIMHQHMFEEAILTLYTDETKITALARDPNAVTDMHEIPFVYWYSS